VRPDIIGLVDFIALNNYRGGTLTKRFSGETTSVTAVVVVVVACCGAKR